MERRKKYIDTEERTQKPAPLGKELDTLIKGIKKYQRQKYAFWESVVGEKIAKVAVPVKNKQGILFVKVQDAVWRFELTRRKDEIIEKVNLHLKKNTIKDIVFI
jgi:predicted nucleic acid-binding Zn ribbon protein